MAAPESLAAARRTVAEALGVYEARVAAGPPRTWTSYLPAKYAAGAGADAEGLASLRELAAQPGAPPRGIAMLTAEEIATLDATVATAPPKVVAEKTAEELFPAAPPPRKKAKIKKGVAAAAAAAAPAAAAAGGVSSHAKAALEACWDMQFGPEQTNPFRTRLTRETCAALGIGDYHDVVERVVDLALLRQRVKAGAYASDDALRVDVRLIATNAAAYHPPESVYVAYAADLAARYDAAYAGLAR